MSEQKVTPDAPYPHQVNPDSVVTPEETLKSLESLAHRISLGQQGL